MAVSQLLAANVGGFTPYIQYPGDNCCTLYKDDFFGRAGDRSINDNIEDYRGTFCHNGNRTAINLHETGWGDVVNSWYCGKNVWYDLCHNGVNNQCDGHTRVMAGAGHMKNRRIRENQNRTSTIVLGPYEPREIGAVTLFEDGDCAGSSGRFYWDPDSNASGTYYNAEDIEYGGLTNNTMNSMAVPAGYIVEVYNGHGFDEAMQRVVGSYKNFSEEMVCVNNIHGDQVSSVIVKRQPQGAANAYWQGTTSSESQEQTYHVGMSGTTVERSQYQEAERMNEALDLGLTILSIWFPPVALIPRQRQVVQRDVSTTYGYDYFVENKTTCTRPEGATGGVGLWQWVVATEDGQTMSFSHHTVCRTGENWNTPPACPYYACLNEDCSECLENWEVAQI